MDAEALQRKGLHPANARLARVRGFALRIGRRAMLVPDAEASVYGFVIGLSRADIDALYSEPSVRDYRPEPVLAELTDGSTIAALCFNLESMSDETNAPYADELRALGRRLGLPLDYLATIR